MKIFMPVFSDGDTKIQQGGIEKFSQQLVDNFPIHPVYISKDDKNARRTKSIITRAVFNESPDMILINDPWTYANVKNLNLPVICFIHEPLNADVRMIAIGKIFQEMIEANVHIYFVSRRQFNYYVDHVKRLDNFNFELSHIKGFINSSYCDKMVFSEHSVYDCTTIGRSEILKNPFKLHKLAKGSDLTSLVITNDIEYKSDNQNDYVKKNMDWEDPQLTFRNLPHDEVLKHLSWSSSYCSTCSVESWGITSMEAFGCGIPVIMLVDKSNAHSSEDIAADVSHYRKIRKSCKPHEFVELVNELKALPTEFRREIFEMTNEKHSKSNWIKTINTIIDARQDDRHKIEEVNNLENFFS